MRAFERRIFSQSINPQKNRPSLEKKSTLTWELTCTWELALGALLTLLDRDSSFRELTLFLIFANLRLPAPGLSPLARQIMLDADRCILFLQAWSATVARPSSSGQTPSGKSCNASSASRQCRRSPSETTVEGARRNHSRRQARPVNCKAKRESTQRASKHRPALWAAVKHHQTWNRLPGQHAAAQLTVEHGLPDQVPNDSLETASSP